MSILKPYSILKWGIYEGVKLETIFKECPYYIEWLILTIPEYHLDIKDFVQKANSENLETSNFDIHTYKKVYKQTSESLWNQFLNLNPYSRSAEFADWVNPFLIWKKNKEYQFFKQTPAWLNRRNNRMKLFLGYTEMEDGKNCGSMVGRLMYYLPNYIEWKIVNDSTFVLHPNLFFNYNVSPFSGYRVYKRDFTELIGDENKFDEDLDEFTEYADRVENDGLLQNVKIDFSFLNDVREFNAYKFYSYLEQKWINNIRRNNKHDEDYNAGNDYLDAFEGDPSNTWNVD